jgi:hypothetical protein
MAVALRDWYGRVAADLKVAEPNLQLEAGRLLRVARRFAPGKLGEAFKHDGAKVVSEAEYAEFLSDGGTIRAKGPWGLRIPLPGQPENAGKGRAYVTIRKPGSDTALIFRKSTRELVAVRKMQVTIRGSRWMQHALAEHEAEAEKRLEREANRHMERPS